MKFKILLSTLIFILAFIIFQMLNEPLPFQDLPQQEPNIHSKIYSPDSSKIIISYSHDTGALGSSTVSYSLIKINDKVPNYANIVKASAVKISNIKWINSNEVHIEGSQGYGISIDRYKALDSLRNISETKVYLKLK